MIGMFMHKYQNSALLASHVAIYFGLAAVSGVFEFRDVALASIVLMALLIWISVWDFRSFTIPDIANLLLVISGLGATWALHPHDIFLHALASVIWFALFWAVGATFRRLRGYDGLGLGDAKLMAGAGAWLGMFAPVSVILMGSISAILFIIVMGLIGRKSAANVRQSAIAFGPFLCVSIWSVWLFGPFV